MQEVKQAYEAMKSYRRELLFDVPARRSFDDITPQVKQALRESGIKEGLLFGECDAHQNERVHQRRRIRPPR